MLANGIKETTATLGTIDVVLTPVTGFARFSQGFALSAAASYVIKDGNNREWGVGTIGAGNTLVRTTITATLVAGTYTSSGATAISLVSGASEVICADHTGTTRSIGNLTGTSLQLLTALTDETGTGSAVFATAPTLVTPVIGAATGTSAALTGAAPQVTLGVNVTTLGSVKMFGNTSGDATIRPAAIAGTATVVTLPNASSTLPIFGQQVTFTGPTAARSIALPDAAFTVARTDAANTFAGVQTMTSPALTTPAITGLATGAGVATTNTASTLVARDASGDFAAGTITAALTGTASGNLVSGGALGTPSSGVLSNLTGTLNAGVVASSLTSVGTLTGLSVGAITGSSTVTFTGSTFTLDEKSNTAFATPGALSATGYRAFASTVSGAAVMGFGTTNDVALINRAGTVCLGVGPNTTLVNIPGSFSVTGASTLSGALTYGGVTLSNAVTGTGNMVLATAPTLTLTNATGLPTAGHVDQSVTTAKIADAAVTQAQVKIKTVVALTDAAATLTATQLVDSGIFTITPTVARTLTTDTAANIVAALPRNQVGTWFEFTIVVRAAFVVTLGAGTGITIVGVATANNVSMTFKARIDSASAITMYRI